MLCLSADLHPSLLPSLPSLPTTAYREDSQARHLLGILCLQRQVEQNVNHGSHQGPVDRQLHAMHR